MSGGYIGQAVSKGKATVGKVTGAIHNAEDQLVNANGQPIDQNGNLIDFSGGYGGWTNPVTAVNKAVNKGLPGQAKQFTSAGSPATVAGKLGGPFAGHGKTSTDDTSGRPPGTGVGQTAIDAPPPGQPYQSAPGNAPDLPPVPGGPGTTPGPGAAASGWPSTGDATIDHLMSLYPKADSVLDRDPTTGAVTGLKSPYQVNRDPNAALAATQIKTNTDIANSTDSSPYAKAELGRQDLIYKNALDQNQRTGQANEGAAEGNLAMRGGLQSGARERLARDSMNQTLLGGQGITSGDQMARANIGINDENQKNIMKAAIPGQDLGLAQYGSGVDMYNTGTMTTGLANDTSNAQKEFGTMGDIFGASKTADAIKGINNTTIAGDAQSAVKGSIPGINNGEINKITGAGLADPSMGTNRQAPPSFNPYASGGSSAPAFMSDDGLPIPQPPPQQPQAPQPQTPNPYDANANGGMPDWMKQATAPSASNGFKQQTATGYSNG